jgi:DNA-binding PadR family transcriptional regulator
MFDPELVILGLLKQGPKHGYQIKKLIHQITESFATVQTHSIYYPLKKMEQDGLVLKEKQRQQRRPEKFTYQITKKGELRFQRLVEQNLIRLERPFLNIDISLYFLPSINRGLALRNLRMRQRGLERIRGWLQHAGSRRALEPHQLAILDHNLELVKAEIQFNTHLVDNFTSLFSK